MTGGFLIPLVSTVDKAGWRAATWRRIGSWLYEISDWFFYLSNECSKAGVEVRSNEDLIAALKEEQDG